jgi:hypothetical protein
MLLWSGLEWTGLDWSGALFRRDDLWICHLPQKAVLWPCEQRRPWKNRQLAHSARSARRTQPTHTRAWASLVPANRAQALGSHPLLSVSHAHAHAHSPSPGQGWAGAWPDSGAYRPASVRSGEASQDGARPRPISTDSSRSSLLATSQEYCSFTERATSEVGRGPWEDMVSSRLCTRVNEHSPPGPSGILKTRDRIRSHRSWN